MGALSSLSSKSVWTREGTGHQLSRNAFAALLSFWTAAGIAASAAAAAYTVDWKPAALWILPAIIVPFLGIFLAMGSDKPILSLLGYALVVVPFGMLAGPMVAMYTAASVAKVFALTTMVVVSLGILGAVWPKSLESWGAFLFGGLLILIFGLFGLALLSLVGVPISGAMTWLDWAGVILFSGYVIYDMNRAMRVERTLDNSIDCAVAVYLDFANIFIRLLSLTGSRKD